MTGAWEPLNWIILFTLALILSSSIGDPALIGKTGELHTWILQSELRLGKSVEHNISIAKPRHSETFSGIAYVGYGAQLSSAEQPHFIITILSANSDWRNVVTVQHNIDGHQGYLTTSSQCQNDTQGFVAQFLLEDIGESGKAECLIASTYPWENGTYAKARKPGPALWAAGSTGCK